MPKNTKGCLQDPKPASHQHPRRRGEAPPARPGRMRGRGEDKPLSKSGAGGCLRWELNYPTSLDAQQRNHKTVFPSCADTHLHSPVRTQALACIGVSMQRTQLLNPMAPHSFAIPPFETLLNLLLGPEVGGIKLLLCQQNPTPAPGAAFLSVGANAGNADISPTLVQDPSCSNTPGRGSRAQPRRKFEEATGTTALTRYCSNLPGHGFLLHRT